MMVEPVVSWSLLEFPDWTCVIVELDLPGIYVGLNLKVDAAGPDAEHSANILGGESGLNARVGQRVTWVSLLVWSRRGRSE